MNYLILLSFCMGQFALAHDCYFEPAGILFISAKMPEFGKEHEEEDLSPLFDYSDEEDEQEDMFISLEYELLLIKNDIHNNNTDSMISRISYLKNNKLLHEEHLITLFHECLLQSFYEGTKIFLLIRPEFAKLKFPKGQTSLHVVLYNYLILRRELEDISEKLILELTKLLCEHGADATIHAHQFFPIDLARALKLDKVVNYLEKYHINNNKPIHKLVVSGSIADLIGILNKVPQSAINDADSFGNTPLHLAIKLNDPTKVELLLQHSADTRLPNRLGLTPQCECLRLGNEEMGALLDRYPSPRKTLENLVKPWTRMLFKFDNIFQIATNKKNITKHTMFKFRNTDEIMVFEKLCLRYNIKFQRDQDLIIKVWDAPEKIINDVLWPAFQECSQIFSDYVSTLTQKTSGNNLDAVISFLHISKSLKRSGNKGEFIEITQTYPCISMMLC